jgi:hypothetical protein
MELRMRTSPLVAVALAALTACATEVKAPTASVVASLSINTGAVAQLDGSASSDPAGRTLSYDWSFTAIPAGSQAALNDPAIAKPSFTPDVAGSYVVQLVVSNGVHPSPPAKVTVTASTCGTARPNAQVQLLAPVAAGPALQLVVGRIPVGAVVSASGAASGDPDNLAPCSAGQTLTYRWTLDAVPAGSATTVNAATSLSPSFTADVPGAYLLGLVVTDSTGLSSAKAAVTMTADPSFGAVLPIAGFSVRAVNAGPAQAMDTPRGPAVDGAGVAFVAQEGLLNGTPHRVTRHQAGGVSILAEGAYLGSTLNDVALDTTGALPRLLVTSGSRVVAVDPTTGLQSLFADFSFILGGRFQGITVGVTATTAATSTWRIAVADRNSGLIQLFDPAAAALPLTAPVATVSFGPGVRPWGVAMLSPAPGTPAGVATWFTTDNAAGAILKNSGGTVTTLLANNGSLVLDGARDLALSPCPTPKLFVANGNGVLVVDPVSGAYKALATGFGTPAGLAFDTSTSPPALLVTDDDPAKNALYRIEGPFCTL